MLKAKNIKRTLKHFRNAAVHKSNVSCIAPVKFLFTVILSVALFLSTCTAFAAQLKDLPKADWTWCFEQGQHLNVIAEQGTTFEILTPGLVHCVRQEGKESEFSTDQKGDAYILFHQPTEGDFLYHLIIGGEEHRMKVEVVSSNPLSFAPESSSRRIDAEAFTNEVIKLVNDIRRQYGLRPLRPARDLMQAAAIRSEEISRVMSHTRPSGLPCQSMFHNGQYTIGENIAGGQSTPEWVVRDWMNSPGHRANILKPDYTEIGVGFYYQATGTEYQHHWVQMFRQPMPQPTYTWW